MADLIFAALSAPVGKRGHGHEHARFKVTWKVTLAELGEELDRIGAKDPTLFVDVAASTITRSGQITGGIAAARSPGVRLEFLKRVRGKADTWVPAVFPCATYWTAQDNVRAITLTLGALRDVSRWGATTSDTGEELQYAGFLRLPAPGGVNTAAVALSAERAARIIVDAHPDFRAASPHVRDATAVALVTTMLPLNVRDVANEARAAAHPDRGGSDAAFVTVQEARAVLLRARGITP